MSQTHFQCPIINCAYAIDSVALNKVKLRVLRRTAKKCPGCGTLAKFLEQTSLPNIQTKQQSLMEGQNYAKISSTNTTRLTAKQRSAREARH